MLLFLSALAVFIGIGRRRHPSRSASNARNPTEYMM